MYQTLQIDDRLPLSGGPSSKGQAIGAGVKLLHKCAVALNDWSISYRVNQELKKISSTIMEKMPRGGGVLVCVGLQEWEYPDPTGTRAKMFLSIHIAGSGNDPVFILNRYLSQPQIVQGAPKGWRRRDLFIWVTIK